ncbi:hypothetical protein ACS0TY_018980 [Phlomoides rotata]
MLEHLDLGGSNFSGIIPPQLGNLTNLRTLILRSNKFDGQIPYAFGKLNFLEEVDLSENMCEGVIPKSLGNLSRFQSLNLYHNDMGSESREESFGNLSCHAMVSLENLWLSYNKFTGPLADLRACSRLRTLYVSSNRLTGPLLPSLGQLPMLEELDISYNSLQGIITEANFVELQNLKRLDLSYNSLTLDLSADWITPFQLEDISAKMGVEYVLSSVFQLSFNNFTGSISSICIYAICTIRWLDVSNNQLEGALPSDWANMEELAILIVNYNILSGEIPHSLGTLSNLQTLHLRGNNFSGELTTTLRNCRLLQQMDIGENRFTGNIPPWLGENHTSLAFLSLTRNMFYGFIPPEICRLTQIQLLDLSDNNNFTALVDKNLTTTTTIDILHYFASGYMDYALVQWKGRSSEYNRILGLLKFIDLSSNKLVGSIPESFSKLKGLISFNLSRNGLTGSIIPGIGEMETLKTLDLSSNQLSGKIPTGLAQLNSLAVLHLENNNLSGEIPKSTQLQSFDASFYAGNDGLCGSPLPLCVNTSIITDQGDDDDDSALTILSSTQEFA